MFKKLMATPAGLPQSSKINNLCEKLCQPTPTEPHRVPQDSYNKITILIEFIAVLAIFLGMIAASWAGCALIDQCGGMVQ